MPTPPLVSETEAKAWLAFLRERQLADSVVLAEIHRMLTSTRNGAWRKESRMHAIGALDRLAGENPEQFMIFQTYRRLTQ